MVIKFGRKTALKYLICKQCQPNKLSSVPCNYFFAETPTLTMARCSSVDEFVFCGS